MKTVRISGQTHKNIMSCGEMGETFDTVLTRIVDCYLKERSKQ
jgi:hypothetical protein